MLVRVRVRVCVRVCVCVCLCACVCACVCVYMHLLSENRGTRAWYWLPGLEGSIIRFVCGKRNAQVATNLLPLLRYYQN